MGVENVFMDQRFPFSPSFFAFIIGVLGKVLLCMNMFFFKSKSLAAFNAKVAKVSTAKALRSGDIDAREPACSLPA